MFYLICPKNVLSLGQFNQLWSMEKYSQPTCEVYIYVFISKKHGCASGQKKHLLCRSCIFSVSSRFFFEV